MTKLIVFVSMLIFLPIQKGFSFDHSHMVWTNVLKEYQSSTGLVNYKKLKKDISEDKSHSFLLYIKSLESVKFNVYKKFSDKEKMAFLINAYNAFTFKLIVDKYPVKSIRDIGSLFTKPWDVEFFSLLDGKIKSLDPIEHKWLRLKFKDFRIHAAVNCASISCPPLRNEAFTAEKLDSQLEEQMKVWIADKSRNEFDHAKKEWKVSKIFDWYESDFKDWGNGVKNIVNKYLPKPLDKKTLEKIDLDYLPYDWNLNEQK